MIGPRDGAAAAAKAVNGPGGDRSVASPRQQAERRLDSYGRYARLLEAQLEALDGKSPDLERFSALAKERAALAEQIDATPRPLPESPELQRMIFEIRDRLQDCRKTDAAVLERLGELRAETARALESLDSRKPGRTGYLTLGGESNGGRRLDVKL